MKILLTIGDITLKGGAERVVANLANAYAQIGLDVEILSFYKSGDKEAFELDNRVKLSYMHQKSFDKKRKNFFYKMSYKFIESHILKRDFKDKDFIIFNNSPHFPLFKNKNTKYIRINHTASKGRYLKRYDYFDTLVLIATGEIDFWKKHHKSVAIIPNFLPNISNLNTNYSQKVILSMGRMTIVDEKGFLRLIDIWKLIQDSSEFKDWKLHIVGDGELKEKIENKIKDLNLTNSIILKPFTKDVESEYLSASIYAMTSHFEGLPMVLIEAQSYALPTISFDIATGPRDIIEDDKSGYLIEDNNLNEYATKLKTLMQDENLRAKMGAKSKEIVKSKFSKDVVMKQWMELFERIKNNA
ncbi:glycosyltransferase family 4 protein [Campylobacter vicugnae]|uniref:glycosyltransferase family 4 protein n=1 Tax=Campylobacter vicugnae TaxID=1660076 RepID=UPI00254F0336|nr:glycosyltransferase family 4 protein [Campylobacter ovis]MDL0105618.1 glycosyltransferase family 4 protein [Campylobacter ovis]MDL0107034.1 glycosyltransferase family 4 protein [Campylobacter ovis]